MPNNKKLDSKNRSIYSKQTTLLIMDAEQTRSVSVNTKLLTLFKPLLAVTVLAIVLSIVAIAYLTYLNGAKVHQVNQANLAKQKAEETMMVMSEEVDNLKNMTSKAVQQKLIGLRKSEQQVNNLQQYLQARGVKPPLVSGTQQAPKTTTQTATIPKATAQIPNTANLLLDRDKARPVNQTDRLHLGLTQIEGSAAMGGPDIKALRSIPYMGDYPMQITDLLTVARRVPIGRPHHGALSSRFGARSNPFGKKSQEFHHGLDFRGNTGEPIQATADGSVIFAGRQNGYGLVVKIKHGYGYSTVYGHLSKLNVSTGDKVKANQIIGELGSTGRSTGPHLHYEVRYHNETQNPEQYLSLDAPALKQKRVSWADNINTSRHISFKWVKSTDNTNDNFEENNIMFGSKKATNQVNKQTNNHINQPSNKEKALITKPVDVGKIDTLISQSCRLEGSISSENSLKIDGQVTGNIQANETVIISQQGKIIGDITANVLIIYGQHYGNSSTQSIHIQDNGYAEGDIDTLSLQVEPTATYKGMVSMSGMTADKQAIEKPTIISSISEGQSNEAAAESELSAVWITKLVVNKVLIQSN